jgi:hypothetical protein
MARQRRMVGNVTLTFDLPKPDFTVGKADAETLKRYGPVGRNEKEQALVDRVISRLAGRAQFIEPEFEALPPRKPPRPKRKQSKKAKVEEADQSDIWAGCVLEAASPQVLYTWISAELTVPNVASVAEGDYGMSSHWIGIDGYTEDTAGQQLCQCGVECDPSAKGVTQPYFWVEWVPGDLIVVRNFVISPGDLLNIALCTTGPGATTATASLANLTTGAATIFTFSAPPGVALGGESAEWISERPFVGEIPPLAQFGSVIFYNAKAGTTQQDFNEAASYGLLQMTRIGDSTTVLCEAECPVDGVLINTWRAHQ